MLVRLKENRDFCLEALAKMPGVTVPKPDGAFYLFPKIAGATDSFDFCKRLLLETKSDSRPASLSARAAKDRCASATPPNAPSWKKPWRA